ncbi:MAG: hypothetical protein NTX85_02680 [Candidatus Nomurabacteria bacterium]|nr:hypothetical protein [Candidatus Nomurabacteria bacterium]
MKKLIFIFEIALVLVFIFALFLDSFKKKDDSALFINGEVLSVRSYIKDQVLKKTGYIASIDSEIDSISKSTNEIYIDDDVAKEFFDHKIKNQKYFVRLQRVDLKSPFFKKK